MPNVSLETKLHSVVEARFGRHPFATNVTRANAPTVMSHYLAMSIAFPYVQAAAIGDSFERAVETQGDVDAEVEATAAVGAFLVSDELCVNERLLSGGLPSLPQILITNAFHANLLRRDLEAIFGRRIAPTFADPTATYLRSLRIGLGNADPMRRVAHMTAFEAHASVMISALWDSLEAEMGCERQSLTYFQTHVGGPDPAEAYHVQMTERLVGNTVCAAEAPGFLKWFEDAYSLNWEWCENIAALN